MFISCMQSEKPTLLILDQTMLSPQPTRLKVPDLRPG